MQSFIFLFVSESQMFIARLEDFTTVKIQIVIFWVVTLSSDGVP